MIKLYLFKDVMRLKTVVRVINYDGNQRYYLNKKQEWIKFEQYEQVREEFLELDHNVEILQDSTTILDTKALVDRIEKDKNCHIGDLNRIVDILLEAKAPSKS